MNNEDFFPDATTVDFIGFSDSKDNISRADIEGEKLWELIFKRDMSFGGILVGIFGMMGSGKTSLLHHIATRVVRENPSELIFWREPLNNPLQVINNGCKYEVFCEVRHPVKPMRLTDRGLIPTNDIPIRRFSGFKKLIDMVDPNTINVVYLDDLTKWIKFVDRLKLVQGWKSCFFDEMEDVCPMRVSGNSWRMNEKFAQSMKEIRKTNINLIYNTQNQMDLDYRIGSKTMMHLYCYGARKDEHSPIFKQTLMGLELGSAWVDLARARFGLIRFPPVEPKQPLYFVVPDKRGGGK